MSALWSVFIIVLTLISIVAYVWLLLWTSKSRNEQETETTGHVWDDDLTELNNPLPRWWLWLFYITIVFSLCYLALYPGLGNFKGLLEWSQIQQHQAEKQKIDAHAEAVYARFNNKSIDELAVNEEALQYGQRLFLNNCSVCHGSDAGGAPGFPSLRDKNWLWGNDIHNIRTSIQQGRQGVMPAWGAALGEQGIEEVTAYIVTLSGRKYREALESSGREKYAAFCTACHGVDGKGNIALGAPDLSSGIWLHGQDLDSIKSVIRDGRTNIMPAHEEILSVMQIDLLTAYIHSLSK